MLNNLLQYVLLCDLLLLMVCFLHMIKLLHKILRTSKAPTNPGPYVGVIASILSRVTFASFSALSATLEIASIWFLDAISGTTPPYFSWIGICVSITFDNISLPFFTIATDVSSQLDSIPHC